MAGLIVDFRGEKPFLRRAEDRLRSGSLRRISANMADRTKSTLRNYVF